MNEEEQKAGITDVEAQQEMQPQANPDEQPAMAEETHVSDTEQKESECLPPERKAGETPPEESKSSTLDVSVEKTNVQTTPLPEEKVDALASKADALSAGLETVRDDVAALQKAVTGFYSQTTDAMHKELEKYRKGLVRTLEQEFFGELLELYDAVDRTIALVEEDLSKAPSLLEGIRDQIDAALFNRNVEKREATAGEKFDGRRHHVVRPDIPTGDFSLDGTVAATVKPGFADMDESFAELRDGCMKLRPIHVRLYKFNPALAQEIPEGGTSMPEVESDAPSPDPADSSPDTEGDSLP